MKRPDDFVSHSLSNPTERSPSLEAYIEHPLPPHPRHSTRSFGHHHSPQSGAFVMAQGRGSAAAGGQAAVALGLVVLCLLLAHVQVAEAATYTVGDSGGWSFNMASWSRGKRFRAGDVLGECWPASCWASVFCRLILFCLLLQSSSTTHRCTTWWR